MITDVRAENPFRLMKSGFLEVFSALGDGGSGITYSQIAAGLLCGLLMSKPNKDSAIYSFDRRQGK